MAARRPPRPRSGASAHNPAREAETGPGQGAGPQANAPGAAPKRPRPYRETQPGSAAAAPRNATPGPAANAPRAKVIPLGPVTPSGKATPGTPRSGKAQPAAAKASPAKSPSGPTGPKAASKPKTGAKGGGSPRSRATASQRRIEDRNLLSGAVRKDEKAAQKTERKGPDGPKKPIPARSFSGRLLALSIALSVFAVLLVPSIGTYARQRDEIAALRTSIAAMQAEQEALKDQIARWDDPLYIKQQARDRINLVMPGERNYMVVGSRPADDVPGEANQSPEEVRTDLPWVDALFDSVQRAATD
ncbi:septum formation initiator family protein [Paeniglutamicibacter sp. ABSL32-1]|uniref:FtsB family cell division protein n=1 Tax=Paeniglutamicibacter quisquiliarum TaxID=2849498 RepID=UPI001C2DCF53|nr:septum formation initiator family protein [Paeniglutamicibacter quisquiliarum]MBV1779136.1 septum formation initiator family protein [Paeniglutamicibacter quisquiliarum]